MKGQKCRALWSCLDKDLLASGRLRMGDAKHGPGCHSGIGPGRGPWATHYLVSSCRLPSPLHSVGRGRGDAILPLHDRLLFVGPAEGGGGGGGSNVQNGPRRKILPPATPPQTSSCVSYSLTLRTPCGAGHI